VFLKPRFASSASGVCAYRWSHHREQLIAPIEIQRRNGSIRLFNSLKVRSYTSPADILAILQQLLPQGMICERWIRKRQLPGGQFDLRVMVIAGEARHTIVRQSHHPITNLHLGNRRGDLREVRHAVGAELVNSCGELAEQAAACFPESLYAGVDILVPARAAPLVCEINAFGDLLPHVRDREESTYEAILRSALIDGTGYRPDKEFNFANAQPPAPSDQTHSLHVGWTRSSSETVPTKPSAWPQLTGRQQ
jgi:hypothetical protein